MNNETIHLPKIMECDDELISLIESIPEFCREVEQTEGDIGALVDIITDQGLLLFYDLIPNIGNTNFKEYYNEIKSLIVLFADISFARALEEVYTSQNNYIAQTYSTPSVDFDVTSKDNQRCIVKREYTLADILANVVIFLDDLRASEPDIVDDAAINIYFNNILTPYWSPRSSLLSQQTGIPFPVILYLKLNIPVEPRFMTMVELNNYVYRFKDVIKFLSLGKKDIRSCLTKHVIKELFHITFGTREYRSALNALGKLLVDPLPFEQDITGWDKAIYKTFNTALYDLLDDYNNNDIRFIMRTVFRTYASNESMHHALSPSYIIENKDRYVNLYDNMLHITKALNKRDGEDAKDYTERLELIKYITSLR